MSEPEQPLRLTRRELLKWGAAAGGSLALSSLIGACGNVAAPPATTSSTGAATAVAAAKRGGNLIYARTVETPTLFPQQGNLAAHRVLSLVYEPLVKLDGKLKIIPGLAEKWEQTDPKTYVFTLRKDARWHNGRALEADDVKFTYDYILDPKNAAPRRADLSVINRIETPDKQTVRITLNNPSGGFLATIADMFQAILPWELIEKGDPRQQAIGTGPYRVDTWVRDNQMKLARNPDYYVKDRPYLDSITVQIIPAEDSIVAGLRGGTVDQATFEDNKNYLLLKDQPSLTALRSPRIGMDFVILNNQIPPFNNVKVRQALAAAIDRQEIMQAALQGLGSVTGPLPPGMPEWALPVATYATYTPNLDKAKALLAEAGFPQGFKTDLFAISTFPTFVAAAQVIAAQLRKINVDVTVTQLEYAIWLDRLNKAKDMAMTINTVQGFADPDPYLYGRFHSKGFNQPNWNEPEVEALLEQGRAETDTAKRKDIYTRLQKMLADEKVPYLWLYSADLIDVSQKAVQGFQQHPTSFLYGMTDTWLNK